MADNLHIGDEDHVIGQVSLEAHLDGLIECLMSGVSGVSRLLIIPPDITRLNSRAGEITAYLWKCLHETVHIDIMPALGTHTPMTETQCVRMFGPDVPFGRILSHRWRTDLRELGELSADEMGEISHGRFAQPMRVAVNRQLFEGNYDLILSVGQVVPHEVTGMANYTKNIVIGVGGKDTIDKSHFLGAACGMETIMGRADTPVRRAIDTVYDRYIRNELPITFLLTVVGQVENGTALRGL